MSNDMDFDFNMFCNDDFLLQDCDIPLPSVETSGDDVALNFNYNFNAQDITADMSFGLSGGDLLGDARHLQGAESATCALLKATENLPASTLPAAPGPIEAMWAPLMNPTPATPEKKTKAPAKSRKPRASKPKAAPREKAPPKPKVTKPKKPAKAHKRTVSAPFGPLRCVGELYHLPWSQLTQEEKGRLLLPLLQGIDPSTGIKIGEPGSLLPPPDFEMIGEDIFGTGDRGDKFMGTSTSPPETQRNSLTITPSSPSAFLSSPAAATTTRDIDAEDAAKYHALMAAQNVQMPPANSTMANANIDNAYKPLGNDFVNMDYCLNRDTNTVASDFQFSVPELQFDVPEFNLPEFNFTDIFRPASQGLGGPCDNGVIGDSAPAPAVQQPTSPVNNKNDFADATALLNARRTGNFVGQIPTPSSDYGRIRQQEALKRNTMLQDAGRRR
ncbi:hypothetical protein J4E91_007801 [Alternaria rosae]|nr:hypothetical protein J4E91_007801 [Alternaria rosae]